jgi:hypothetical protein
MFGLDASFGARAKKALKPAVTECLDHETSDPDRIQDAMTWRFEAGERLTFHLRVRQAAKVPPPFRHLSRSIACTRKSLKTQTCCYAIYLASCPQAKLSFDGISDGETFPAIPAPGNTVN